MKPFFKYLVVVILIITTTIFLVSTTGNALLIRDGNSNKVIARYPLQEGEQFAIGFTHSVNQNFVEDRYQILNQEIQVYETLYYHFGAGVQTELKEQEILTYLEDGGMLISNINQSIPHLYYNISPVYDHILRIHETEISLKELAGETSFIEISFEPSIYNKFNYKNK